MDIIKKVFLNKYVCLFWLIGAFVYGLVLPFCFGNDPFSPLGTMSILCEDRKILFWIWVALVGGGYLLNTNYAFKKFDEKSKFLRVLSWLTFFACCAIALSLKHDITTWNPKRIVHWVATGIYIVCIGLCAVIFLVKNRKRYSGFVAMTIATLAMVACIPLWLLIIGKSAMMEMIPNAMFQVLLMLLNFTNIAKPKIA